jgi:hypothetical protein
MVGGRGWLPGALSATKAAQSVLRAAPGVCSQLQCSSGLVFLPMAAGLRWQQALWPSP